MAEPTLPQIFGNNATQTATQLIISKADLSTVGLTPQDINSAESLFIAVFLLGSRYLNSANQISNPDIQITIADGIPAQSLVTRNSQQYRQRLFALAAQRPDAGAILDPDDF